MLTKEQALIVTAAGIGGAAANLVDLAQIWTGREPWLPGPIYYVGLLIFFIMGAAVALIFAETDHRKAFFLGISLPALIAAAQTHGSNGFPTNAETIEVGSSSFFNTAFAQQTPTPSPNLSAEENPIKGLAEEENQKPIVGSLQLIPNKECPYCELYFYDKNGQFLQKLPLDKGSEDNIFLLPENAEQFGVWNKRINPKIWAIPPETDKERKFEFTYDGNLWNDFRRGLVDFNIRPYDIEITPKFDDGSGT